jgi:ABC-type Na+ transport system ATPase subunit NatA
VCPQIKVYSTHKKLCDSDMMIDDGSIMTEPATKKRRVEEEEEQAEAQANEDLDAPSDEEPCA